MMSPPITGSSRSPEPIALVPSTPWKYCGSVKRTPIMESTANRREDDPPREGRGVEE